MAWQDHLSLALTLTLALTLIVTLILTLNLTLTLTLTLTLVFTGLVFSSCQGWGYIWGRDASRCPRGCHKRCASESRLGL